MELAYFAMAAFFGVASHVVYFHRCDVHRHIEYLVLVFLSAPVGTAVTLSVLLSTSPIQSILTAAALCLSFAVGAVGSTAFYRAFLNPLNKFPGPYAARFTDFWMFFKVGKNLNQYYVLQDLHKQYGEYVRVGSRNISIADPQVVSTSFKPGSPALKGHFYDIDYPNATLQTYRDKAMHDRHRRMWAPAFGDRALREYEPRVSSFNDKFVARLAEFKGGPVNISKWSHLYSFDVMGSLALGKDYKMLESGESHHVLGLITENLSPLGLSPPMWFVRLMKQIPGDPAGLHRLDNFCSDELQDAVLNQFNKEKDGGSTISSWLYKNHQHKSNPGRDPVFVQEAKLLVVAGSDTTAAALAFIFFKLAQYPEHAEKIRQELRECIKGREWTYKDIQNCQHLNACIDESLRLHSVGPSGLFRETPPEGMYVGDVFIPGNKAYQVSPYVLGHSETIYQDAESFIPERWYSRPELIKIKGCHTPFIKESPYSCIGRNVALMEIRTLMARVLLEYKVAFAPGEDGYRLLNESKDHFTMSLAPLDLAFTPLNA